MNFPSVSVSVSLLLLSASICPCMDLDEFRSLPDNRLEARRSLGVRCARAVGADKVEIVIGLSVTGSARNPMSYRIISEDDERYSYDGFVKPLKADIRKELDCEAVAGAPFAKYERTIVALQLPFPMKEKARYFVVAQGVGGEMVTGACTAAGFVYEAAEPPASGNSVDIAVLGLRQLMPAGNGVIKLEFGPDFSEKAASVPSNYKVMLNGRPVNVVNLGRISKIDTYLPTGWPFVAIPMHEVFLRLSEKFKDGDRISVEISKSLTNAASTAEIIFRDSSSFSDSIKVNQIGYLSDSPVKAAYLGRWMGSFPEIKEGQSGAGSGSAENDFWENLGNVKSQGQEEKEGMEKEKDAAPGPSAPVMGPALAFENPPQFHVLPENGGKPVFTGTARLVHRSGEMDEGVYSVDHSGENVYVLDFTEFKTPGRYLLSVPGVGRSLPFAVGDDVYAKAFEIQSHGVFTQRCGIELKPPCSGWRRIACHADGIVLTSQRRLDKHELHDLKDKIVYESASETSDPASAALAKDKALKARYLFDGDLKDVSGNGLDLKASIENPRFSDSDMKAFQKGKNLGPSLDKQKNGGSCEIAFDISNGATVSFWTLKDGRANHGGFFSMGSNPGCRFQLGASWGVPMLMAGKGNVSLPTVKMGRICDKTWHHIAATLDPAGKKPRCIALYDNGVQVGSEIVGEMDDSLCGPLDVASIDGDEAGGAFFEDFRIYARTLSSDEIEVLATPQPAERPVKINAFGGHHDAGDYNPRAHHEVAQKLMDAYEMAPGKFHDGQLNIPEKGNGIPDILDEAFWSLRIWIGLQDSDGGVRNGTESHGDPNFIQTVELDPTGDYAYAKDAKASFLFAGFMAQASRIWRSLGKESEAADFLSKAEKAYGWACANPMKAADAGFFGHHVAPPRAYAAAQLLHTTGDRKYNEEFRKFCVWSRRPDADLEVYGKYDMQDAAWAYAACPAKFADAELQEAVKKAIVAKADLFISHCSTMSYAFIRHPWAPINWGTGAYENFLNPVLQAYKLTGDRKYLGWIVRTCDNTLGANPICRSYVVGAGTRTVRAPLHNSRYGVSGEVVDGQQVEGPVQKGDGYRVPEVAYPKIRDNFASLYTFVDNHFAIAMDEGGSVNQAQSMAVFGLLLPDRR